jgi:multisubunit Na+/H+ antiporter MnhG subunit
VTHDIALAFLAAGCACELICVAGVLWFRSGFDQLHFASAAATVGVLAIAVAVGLTGFSTPSGTIECIVALLLTFCLGPLTTSAVGRLGRHQRFGTVAPLAAEFEQQP